MTGEQISTLAEHLRYAEKTRIQCRQFSLDYPAITIKDAYAIQQAWISSKLAAGRTVRGHKVGLTSKVMQQSSNINEPDFGVLLDDMFFANASTIPFARFIVPRVEVELAFILAQPLRGPHCTLADVLRATAYVTPSVEIIDARIQQIDPATQATRKVFDTISDNAASAGVVLGGHRVAPTDADLAAVTAAASHNGIVEESGVAAAVLDHPANGVAWLANKLAEFDVELQPGEVILSGSFTRPIPAHPGSTFEVDYGALGVVSLRFSE